MTEQTQTVEPKELSLVDEQKPIATVESTETASVLQMIQFAVQADKPIEYVKELMALEREYKADRARDAFFEAMAGFRGEAVEILKKNVTGFDHKTGGGRTEYSYEDLADAVEAAVPALSKWGLSHSWDLEEREDGRIRVTCELSHKQGHSKRVSLSAHPDTSGKKNPIQAVKSAVTYLERITFMATTGLAAKGMDDDGHGTGGGREQEPEYIDEEHVKIIKQLLDDTSSELGAYDPEHGISEGFLGFCKCPSLEEIPTTKYEYIYLTLKGRQKEQQHQQEEAQTDD